MELKTEQTLSNFSTYLLSCINQYKYRKGLLPMQYVFLIRSSAGGKKYVQMLMNTCMQYNHTIRICIALL